MHKILVSIYPSEEEAYQGVDALRGLHDAGDITMYAYTLIAKQPDGTAAVRQSDDPRPMGTFVGLVGGAVIGMLAGPVGVAIGATFGGATGVLYDLLKVGIGTDFVDDVSSWLESGTSAVVADVDESWILPVDEKLATLGAKTTRYAPSETIDEQLNNAVHALSAELALLRVEMRESNEKARATLQARIDADVRKAAELNKRVEAALDRAKVDFEARLAILRAQREHAAEQRRVQIDERIAELKADYELRRGKLDRARELSKEASELRREALAPTR